jgi:imidazolonepropionase-like amidohydrolase
MRKLAVLSIVVFVAAATAQTPERSKAIQPFLRVDAPKVVLSHVRVIDGTGKPAVDDQDLVLENGKIAAIRPGGSASGEGATVLDLRGYSVIPGIVGMHNHLFYITRPNLDAHRSFDKPVLVPQMTFSAPRLYLAAGVTTMRTTGSVETYADLNLKKEIDAGNLPGPHLDVTGPYVEGAKSFFIQMPHLDTPDDAKKLVDYWAGLGVTSFKAYVNITRAQLKAAVDAAHARGLKVTGHLCAVTYTEAAEIGIDNLEHGFFVNTQLDPGKKPDACSEGAGFPTLAAMTPESTQAKELIATLVRRKVAITSTLPVFENMAGGGRPHVNQKALDAMTPRAREDFSKLRNTPPAKEPPKFDTASLFKNGMALERAFAAAGGLLIAGPDPTGKGDVVPGFGDQRGIELLVEAGFSPVEAIKIATWNGALYLGRDREIGSLAVGKNADIVVIKGDPSKTIADIENVEIVFKDGVGYDSQKLLDSVRGRYGDY